MWERIKAWFLLNVYGRLKEDLPGSQPPAEERCSNPEPMAEEQKVKKAAPAPMSWPTVAATPPSPIRRAVIDPPPSRKQDDYCSFTDPLSPLNPLSPLSPISPIFHSPPPPEPVSYSAPDPSPSYDSSPSSDYSSPSPDYGSGSGDFSGSSGSGGDY